MSKTISITIDIPLKEEKLENEEITAENIKKNLSVQSHEVVDGIEITRSRNIYSGNNLIKRDVTNEFFLNGKKAIIKDLTLIEKGEQ